MTDIQVKSGVTKTNNRGRASDYDQEMIAQGKQLVVRLEAIDEWVVITELELGQLAALVETKYREKSLSNFAEEIGISADRLNRCRSVYRAFKDNNFKGAPPKFSVLQALQGHPGRYEILEQYPNLTMREARTRMKDYRKGQGTPEPEEQQNQEQEPQPQPEQQQPEQQPEQQPQESSLVIEARRWITKPVTLAKMAVESRCGHVTQQYLDPAILRPALSTTELGSPEQTEATLRAGGEELITLADKLKGALALALPPPDWTDETPTTDEAT